MALFAPTTFGKYFLYEKLAAGGMAEIYKAKLFGPGGFEKLLVIKQIKAELARQREFVDLFVDEAKVTVQLSHGNIVPVYELGMVDGVYFIALEYVDGPPLDELLFAARARGRRLGPALAVTLAVEILKGLDYAHRQHIVHRDLSPGNVLCSRQGEVKIVDFGLATSAARLAGRTLVGSIPYMSPEQASAGPCDARSDLFSAGVLLWEMLVGRPLFASSAPEETLACVQAARVPAPSSLAPEVPVELDAIVLRALARAPEQRYGRAAEFLGDLVRHLYARGTLPQQEDVGRFVRELFPAEPAPVGAATKASDATPVLGTAALRAVAPVESSPGTARTTGREVSFATNVAFQREVLTRVTGATPALPLAATRRPARTGRGGSLALARRFRAPLLALAGVALLAASAAVLAHRRSGSRSAAAPVPPTLPAARAPSAAPPAATDSARPNAAASAAPPTDAPPHRAARPTLRSAGAPRVGGPPAAPPSPPAAAARLTLNATPWADFYLDGKRLSGCPVKDLPAPAGPHAIRVVCPDREERTQPLRLGPGTSETHVFDCTQPGIPQIAP